VAPLRVRPTAEPPLRVRPAGPDVEERERPPLRVVPRRVRRRRVGVAAAAGVTLVFVLMLGLVAFQAKLAQDQLDLDRIERAAQEAELRYAQLRLRVAQLESPQRVVAEAKRLGLIRPEPDEIVYLRPPESAAAQAISATGPTDPRQSSGSANAAEWAEVKPLLRGGP
jgi:cell division protein FtsL